VYDGNWQNGLQHGQGKHVTGDGTVYNGPWADGKHA